MEDLNDHRVRNHVIDELNRAGRIDWGDDHAAPPDVRHLQSVAVTLVALEQNLGKEIDQLRADLAEGRQAGLN